MRTRLLCLLACIALTGCGSGAGAKHTIVAAFYPLAYAAQTMSPSYLRARALSMYLLVLQGGMAVGSAVWGMLASRSGIPAALLVSAVALVAGLITVPRHRLSSEKLKFAPAVVRD